MEHLFDSSWWWTWRENCSISSRLYLPHSKVDALLIVSQGQHQYDTMQDNTGCPEVEENSPRPTGLRKHRLTDILKASGEGH